jgi:hypothetical protein
MKQHIQALGGDVQGVRDELKHQKGMFDKIVEKFEKLFKGDKAVEVDARPTEYEDEAQMADLRTKLYNVVWTLDNVLWNILYNEELDSEEKVMAITKAFNAAKQDYLDTFSQISAIAEAAGVKVVSRNDEPVIEGHVMSEEIKPQAAPDEEPEAEEVEAKAAEPEKPEAKVKEEPEVSPAPAQNEVGEKVDQLIEKIETLTTRIEALEKNEAPSASKFAEAKSKKAAQPDDVNHPDFWK